VIFGVVRSWMSLVIILVIGDELGIKTEIETPRLGKGIHHGMITDERDKRSHLF